MRPKPDDKMLIGVVEDEILKLDKPFYGHCDAGDYLNDTINQRLIKDLNMEC